MAAEEIWIIGTEPPCPRCDYLTRMVKDIVTTAGIPATVRHLAYTCEEAHQFAASLGLRPGTAKDVARIAAVDVDWNQIHALIDGPDEETAADRELSCCPPAATKWSPALDEALRPCEQIARKAGILMTPVLVLGGRLFHQGSVPDRRRVNTWIREYFGDSAEGNQSQHIVEVLGPGCIKCNTLYDNVLKAVAQSGLGDRVTVWKRTDIAYFQDKGVFFTPGLVINGKVISKGKALSADQVADHLKDHFSIECN
ncbi:MAG: MTH895/ArsE family thioredoxin-like protein [Desulfobacterales bacterium]